MTNNGTNAQLIAGCGGQEYDKDIQLFPVPSGKYIKFVRWDAFKKPSEAWSASVFPFDQTYNDFCYFYPCIGGMTQSGGGFSSVDYVIENFRDGTTWYRKWNSGFLEQGGESTNGITTKFKTYFIDNLYTINGNFIGDSQGSVTGKGTQLGFNVLTPSSFFAVGSWTCEGHYGNTTDKMKFRWKAEGYWK